MSNRCQVTAPRALTPENLECGQRQPPTAGPRTPCWRAARRPASQQRSGNVMHSMLCYGRSADRRSIASCKSAHAPSHSGDAINKSHTSGSWASSIMKRGVCRPCTEPRVSLRMPRKVNTPGILSAAATRPLWVLLCKSLRPVESHSNRPLAAQASGCSPAAHSGCVWGRQCAARSALPHSEVALHEGGSSPTCIEAEVLRRHRWLCRKLEAPQPPRRVSQLRAWRRKLMRRQVESATEYASQHPGSSWQQLSILCEASGAEYTYRDPTLTLTGTLTHIPVERSRHR